MNHKFDKEDILMGSIIIITAIVSFLIGNSIGVRTKFVFMFLIVIEFCAFCLIKRISNKQTEDSNSSLEEIRSIEQETNYDTAKENAKTNNSHTSPNESYHNPMQERFDTICAYSMRLEAVGYDIYKIYLPTNIKEKINLWEKEHQIVLPQGYKDWLLLSDGFDDISGTQLYPLEAISQYPFPDYEDYYIIGSYIGDGSDIVIDKIGGCYELDHVYGLEATTFETFIDRWAIETLENGLAEAGIKKFYNINNLFSSYDLFSSTGWDNIRKNLETKCPEMSVDERNCIEGYLKSFYNHCVDYGDKLATKYKTPFLPDSIEAQKEIQEYVRHCKEKYIDIDENHITEIFSNVCWLSNR